MAADDHLSTQLQSYVEAHADERGFITGQAARTLFRQANIRMWPAHTAPHLGRSEGNIVYDPDWRTGEPATTEIRPTDTLHTAQQHLHGPTLLSMVSNYRDDAPDHPIQVYASRAGHDWIEEGTHRLVAHRLRNWTADVEYGSEWHGR